MAYSEIGIKVIVSGVAEAHRQIGAARNDLDRFSRDINSSANAITKMGREVARVGDALVSFGRTLTFAVTAPVLGMGTAFLKAGIDFEQAFAGVGKTVDGVVIGYDEVAKSLFGVTRGLNEAQKAAVFADERFGDLTEDGKRLYDMFRGMSLEIPFSATELARLGEIAGQLGVPMGKSGEIIGDFTKSMAMMGTATNLSSDQAADAIARFANIMGVADEDLADFASRAGSAIVHLGNISAATESEIVAMIYRLAGTGQAVGLTSQQIIGLATSISELGIKSEMGGSAVSRILQEMSFAANDFNLSGKAFDDQVQTIDADMQSLQSAISRGIGVEELKAQFTSLNLDGIEGDLNGVTDGTLSLQSVLNDVRTRTLADLKTAAGDARKQLTVFAQAMGMTEQATVSLIKTNPEEALKRILMGLTRMQEAGELSSDTLADLSLNTIRLKDVIMRLGPNVENMTANINQANDAWSENISLQEEFEKQAKTIHNQLILLKNTFSFLGQEIFAVVRDDLYNLITRFREIIMSFAELDPAIKKQIIRWGLLAAAIGPVMLAVGTLAQISGIAAQGLGILLNPLTSLTRLFRFGSIFDLLLGSKDKKGARAGGLVKSTKGILNNLLGSIGKLFLGLKSTGSSLFIKPLAKVFGGVLHSALFVATGSLKLGRDAVTNVAGLIAGFFKNAFALAANFIPGGALIGKVITAPFSLLKSSLGALSPVLGAFKGVLGQTLLLPLQLLGGTFGKIIKIVPVFGSVLGKSLLGILGKLPLIIGGIAAGLTLLFAPKVISQAIKNKDKLFDELKLSFKQFNEDMKAGGLQKSILLFFSGGSTGSGRKGGLRGIALALGASEKHANAFSYAMGTASFWVIRIFQTFSAMASKMFAVLKTGQMIGNTMEGVQKSTGSTSERLINLAEKLAKFLEGLNKGFLFSTGGILKAVQNLHQGLEAAFESLGNLFDAVFGKAQSGVQNVIATLEPGVETATMTFGERVGQFLAKIVELTINGVALISGLVGKVAQFLADIVTAYKDNGIEGVLGEFADTAKSVWDGVVSALDTLWDSAKPKLQTAFDSAWNWIKTEGVQDAFDAGSAIVQALSDALTGTDPQRVTRDFVNAMRLDQTGQVVGSMGVMPEEDYLKKRDEWFRQGITTFPTPMEITQTLPGSEGLLGSIKKVFEDIYSYLATGEGKDKIISGLKAAWNALSDLTTYLWKGGEGFSGLKKPLEEDVLPSLETWFSDTGTKLGNAFIKALSDILTPDDWATLVTEDVGSKKWLKALTDILTPAGLDKELGDSTKGVVNKMLEKALDTGEINPMLRDRLKALFSDTGTQASTDLLNGLEQGFINEQQRAELAATLSALGIITATKNTFGTRSPSTVFQVIGADLINGLLIGINNQTPVLEGALTAILFKFNTFGLGVANSLLPAQAALLSLQSLVSMVLSQVTGSVSSIVSTLTGSIVGGNTSYSKTTMYNNFAPTLNASTTTGQTDMTAEMLRMYRMYQQVAVG